MFESIHGDFQLFLSLFFQNEVNMFKLHTDVKKTVLFLVWLIKLSYWTQEMHDLLKDKENGICGGEMVGNY